MEIETAGHHNVAPEDRLCTVCGEENILSVEDEYHVLFHCPTHECLTEHKFIKYLQIEDQEEKLIDQANFISGMFKNKASKV